MYDHFMDNRNIDKKFVFIQTLTLNKNSSFA